MSYKPGSNFPPSRAMVQTLRNLQEQRRWIESKGQTLSGYLDHYSDAYERDQIRRIFNADIDALTKAQNEVSRLRKFVAW